MYMIDEHNISMYLNLYFWLLLIDEHIRFCMQISMFFTSQRHWIEFDCVFLIFLLFIVRSSPIFAYVFLVLIKWKIKTYRIISSINIPTLIPTFIFFKCGASSGPLCKALTTLLSRYSRANSMYWIYQKYLLWSGYIKMYNVFNCVETAHCKIQYGSLRLSWYFYAYRLVRVFISML